MKEQANELVLCDERHFRDWIIAFDGRVFSASHAVDDLRP